MNNGGSNKDRTKGKKCTVPRRRGKALSSGRLSVVTQDRYRK